MTKHPTKIAPRFGDRFRRRTGPGVHLSRRIVLLGLGLALLVLAGAAWEIANRNNIFDCVGMKRLPFLANSDFHKPKHIYSWKTLLYCEKNADAIKECVRRNEHVSITLYREDSQFAARTAPREFPHEKPDLEVISGQLSIAHR